MLNIFHSAIIEHDNEFNTELMDGTKRRIFREDLPQIGSVYGNHLACNFKVTFIEVNKIGFYGSFDKVFRAMNI